MAKAFYQGRGFRYRIIKGVFEGGGNNFASGEQNQIQLSVQVWQYVYKLFFRIGNLWERFFNRNESQFLWKTVRTAQFKKSSS